MHQVFFAAKRAFHATVALTRRQLRAMGLTAARLDLLYAVDFARDDEDDDPKGRDQAWQSSIRRTLGVSATVVSRMTLALETLGLVKRERCEYDRRQIVVSLTREGRSRIRRAIRWLNRSGYAQLAVDSALLPETWGEEDECLDATSLLLSGLDRIRRAFGDVAELSYPWFPEDDDARFIDWDMLASR